MQTLAVIQRIFLTPLQHRPVVYGHFDETTEWTEGYDSDIMIHDSSSEGTSSEDYLSDNESSDNANDLCKHKRSVPCNKSKRWKETKTWIDYSTSSYTDTESLLVLELLKDEPDIADLVLRRVFYEFV